MKGIALVLLVLMLALLIREFRKESVHAREHNARQVDECRRLGGFALLTPAGRLMACTFPVGGTR